ncbi:unnamed protein product [Meloidogyne enterolobii]|uniref:Uncharacterized protein n=1 Tax=Meloidogyne enterolobii TaxID=390850 RepID=A0ACB0YR48_MELEN
MLVFQILLVDGIFEINPVGGQFCSKNFQKIFSGSLNFRVYRHQFTASIYRLNCATRGDISDPSTRTP